MDLPRMGLQLRPRIQYLNLGAFLIHATKALELLVPKSGVLAHVCGHKPNFLPQVTKAGPSLATNDKARDRLWPNAHQHTHNPLGSSHNPYPKPTDAHHPSPTRMRLRKAHPRRIPGPFTLFPTRHQIDACPTITGRRR